MFQGDNINGYQVLQDFTTAGGGLSKWTFATRDGQEFFLKQFLAPKYPTSDAPGSASAKQRRLEECMRFEAHHRRLMQRVSERCGAGGNLVFTIDFFREGTSYYKVTEKIDVRSLSIKEIAALPLAHTLTLMKTIAHSLSILHQAAIVHADLKPDNVLIKHTRTGAYTTKLIDFDNSFLSGEPPLRSEEIVGDMAYYAPEIVRYLQGAPEVSAQLLTTAVDIFALGLLYTQYLTGEMPRFSRKQHGYAGSAVAAGQALRLSNIKGLPRALVATIRQMLAADYRTRPTAVEVFQTLKSIAAPQASEATPINLKGGLSLPQQPAATASKTEKADNQASMLKGRGLEIAKKK